MQNYLLDYDYNYADEFDCRGFAVLTEDQRQTLLENINTATYPIEVYFGSNQELLFESSKEVLTGLQFIRIEDHEADFLKKKLCSNYEIPAFGTAPLIIEYFYWREYELI